MKKTVALLGLIVFFFSCDVAKQVVGTYALTQCKYDYQSISGLTLAGINLQNVSSISSLNPLTAANLLAAFSSSSGSLPLNFTLNLDVSNPGTQTAILNGANYILEIDGMEMTQGLFNQQFQIGSGGKTTLPIAMAFDLKKVLSGKSMDAIKNLAFNFAGIGTDSSNVTVKLKPSFVVGGKTINAPDYIPISFTLNKK
ncbi:MAG: hypothetical protein FWF53_07380 [Candidatus Azobacteroides sp.]|nr:hypothetical protein [Candidatus Azobacteroides sp.]